MQAICLVHAGHGRIVTPGAYVAAGDRTGGYVTFGDAQRLPRR